MTGVLVHNRVSQSHFVRLLQQFCGLPCRNVCLTTERAVWVQALATGTLFGQSDKMLAVICDELASHFDVITWVLRLGSSTRLRIRSWLWQVLDKSYWHTCTCTHTLSMYLHVTILHECYNRWRKKRLRLFHCVWKSWWQYLHTCNVFFSKIKTMVWFDLEPWSLQTRETWKLL